MIRNLVLDMGNVLIKYDPARFVARLELENPSDGELLLREIFYSKDWALQDRGALDEAELLARVCGRIPPRLHGAARQLIFHWNEPIEPIPGMAEFARACKAAGLGLYLLSNASIRHGQYWHQVPGNAFFDGRIISAEAGCVKPEEEIYRRLLARYGLRAEECVFVDDMPENVEGARRVGMRGMVFGGADALRAELMRLGVQI